MSPEDQELARRFRERIRRALFTPPNRNRVTDWAYEVCCEHLISEMQLIEWVLQSEDFDTAYRKVYGPLPHEIYGDDWKALAVHMRQWFQWSYELIASLVQGWHGCQNASTVRKLFDPDSSEKRKVHDATYWAKLQQDEERYEARKARMREYSREHYRRNK